MKNQLVTNENMDLVEIVNDKIVVSSKQVAEKFEKQHKDVLRLTSVKLRSSNSDRLSQHFSKTTYTDEKGEQRPMYLMDRDGFSFLVMGFTGEKADKWKLDFIDAFNAMEAKLKLIEQQELGRLIERIKGKEVRRTLTDAIKENVPESPSKKWMYKNFTDLVYKSTFGMTAKQMRVARGLDKKANIRDFLSEKELKKVKAAESIIKGYLDMGDTYVEINDALSGKFIAN